MTETVGTAGDLASNVATPSVRRVIVAALISLLVALLVAVASIVLLAMVQRAGWTGVSTTTSFQRSLWALVVSVTCGIAYFCYRADSGEYSILFARRRVETRWYGYAVVAALLLRGVSKFMPHPDVDPLSNPNSVESFFANAGTGPGAVVLAFVFIAAFIPLIEELLFRRLVFAVLRRWRWLAFIVSVVVFGLVHASEVRGLAVLLGIVSAYLLMRSQSLWPSIVCHGVFNATGVLVVLMQAAAPA